MARPESFFPEHVRRRLALPPPESLPPPADAAVLVLLGPHPGAPHAPCLILTKRSQRVRQPGDLCYPGGRTHAGLDPLLARLLRLPGTPLTRWPGWRRWRRQPPAACALALQLAAALRECAEEMRLAPWGVRLLGPLPHQPLALFQRRIAPLVCWLPRPRRFAPNWEVERVIHLPLAELLQPRRYACYRLFLHLDETTPWRDLPCFVLDQGRQREILWGVSFRITMDLLALLYGFQPPPLEGLPVIRRTLEENYRGR
jgi:8-oxo-dGTP pyrophosphatase MutT (NUDIX family)